jgi:hypothetical protein
MRKIPCQQVIISDLVLNSSKKSAKNERPPCFDPENAFLKGLFFGKR